MKEGGIPWPTIGLLKSTDELKSCSGEIRLETLDKGGGDDSETDKRGDPNTKLHLSNSPKYFFPFSYTNHSLIALVLSTDS